MRARALAAAALALGAIVQSGPAAADTQDRSVVSEQRPKLAVVLRGPGTRVEIAPAAASVTVIVVNNPDLTCRIHRGYQQARKHVHCSDGQIVQLPFN